MRNPRLAIVFLVLTVLIDAMSIGVIIPVMPALIQEVGGGSDLSSAAVWGGILATVFALMQFLAGPTLGKLSDRFGRRPVLLLSLAFLVIDYVILIFAESIWLLLAARVIGGVTTATIATANACIADISAPEKKAANFGLLGAAFGVGVVIGPLLGAVLAEAGTRVPFWAAAALALLNLIFGLVVLPETLKPEKRRRFSWSEANPFAVLAEVTALKQISRLLIFMFVLECAFVVYPAVWAYYTQFQFDWGPREVGISLATYGICMAAVQAGLIRILIPRWGERRCIWAGLGVELIAFLGFAFITQGWMVFLVIPISALGAVITPSLQGLMSRAVSDETQGALQGVITSARSLAMILGPLVMTMIFRFYTREEAPIVMAGAPFLLSFLLALGCVGIFASYRMTKESG
ncbi:MAG: TCR/Tet family MFS transporter [Verrucomicrobiota bacterium]